MSEPEKEATCGFCGKQQAEVEQLIAGPKVNICDECVVLCSSLLHQNKDDSQIDHASELVVPKPHEIKSYLDEYVIGQQQTKRVLSVAVHNHYKRVKQESYFDEKHEFADVEIEKSNIMLVGPTGCGKTLLARTLARCLDVPFSIADATTLTEAGYVGEDVENILLRLIQSADFDLGRAQLGIIYIDELDKIGRRTQNVSITRDVSGEGVQQALLKILEGTLASVPRHGGRKHPQQEYLKIDTSNILFICGGAFVGLGDIIKRRMGKHVLGFAGASPGRATKMRDTSPGTTVAEPEDLLKFGLIPELVGRLPVVTAMSDLGEEDMIRILVEPRNCMVRQYQKLMAMEDIKLTFTDAALSALARAAIEKGTGARGLRSMLEQVMLDIMFEAPMKKKLKSVCVDKKMVDRYGTPNRASREKIA